MKNVFFVLVFLLGLGLSYSMNSTYENESEFPEYHESMNLGVDCEANCTFSSCSSSAENCSCSCGLFKCNCKIHQGLPSQRGSLIVEGFISMDEYQYKNTRLLANVLNSLDDEYAKLAYKNLSSMVSTLKNRSYDSFYEYRHDFNENLNNLSAKSKVEVNLTLEVLGSTERV